MKIKRSDKQPTICTQEKVSTMRESLLKSDTPFERCFKTKHLSINGTAFHGTL